jgi:hypothetical protein
VRQGLSADGPVFGAPCESGVPRFHCMDERFKIALPRARPIIRVAYADGIGHAAEFGSALGATAH